MASRYMTKDKTLWILVNSDFSGRATVGYRLDDNGNPIAEHERTYQWTLPAHELLTGYIGEREIADPLRGFWEAPRAWLLGPNGYPANDKGAIYDVPHFVVARAVALAVVVHTLAKLGRVVEALETDLYP